MWNRVWTAFFWVYLASAVMRSTSVLLDLEATVSNTEQLMHAFRAVAVSAIFLVPMDEDDRPQPVPNMCVVSVLLFVLFVLIVSVMKT